LIYIAVIKIIGVEPSLWGYLFARIDKDLASIAIVYVRIAIISLAALIMAIFLGYYVATRPGIERIFIPASQVVAAIPAPAYFPLLYGVTHRDSSRTAIERVLRAPPRIHLNILLLYILHILAWGEEHASTVLGYNG